MMRRLRELDRLDAQFGLGTTPGRRSTPIRERTRSGLVLVVSVLVVMGVLVGPGGALPDSWARRIGLGDEPLGRPPTAPSSTSYSYLQTQADGETPIAWDPCRKVRYAINPSGGPDDSVAMVRDSVAEVSRLTGLKFEYVGPTGDRPHWRGEHEWLPRPKSYEVLVSWATADEVPELAGSVAGIGGSQSLGLDRAHMRYVSGGATLDRDSFDAMEQEPDGRAFQRTIVLHELGHAVGLGHVKDPRQLMYDDNVGQLDFADGDRAGLAKLGAGRCF